MTPRPTAGTPLKRAILLTSAVPSSTAATSPRRIGFQIGSPPRRVMMSLLNSSGVLASERTRTLASRGPLSIYPEGVRVCWLVMVFMMSSTVISWPAILSVLSQILMFGST